MEAGCRALADAVGDRVIAGDIAGVRTVLAPWLQVELAEASLEALLAAASDGLAMPASWTVDAGMADLETLRSPDGFGPPTQLPPPRSLPTTSGAGSASSSGIGTRAGHRPAPSFAHGDPVP